MPKNLKGGVTFISECNHRRLRNKHVSLFLIKGFFLRISF